MKNSWCIILATVAILLNACSGPAKKPQNRFGTGNATVPSSVQRQDTQFVGQLAPSPSPSPEVVPELEQPSSIDGLATTAPSSTSAPVKSTQDMPYATPVPGKSGLVTSPFAPYAGYVDVRGYPPGQEVKCPYTGKLFRVP